MTEPEFSLEERSYQTAIMRDGMALFTAAYFSHNQVGTTPEMEQVFAIIEGSDVERRGPLLLATARFAADFIHFVDHCTSAAGASLTELERGFTADLLTVFNGMQQRGIDHYEATGEFL